MSFSDLMSSGRGPGVIGMLMALVVVAGFGLLFMFAFDEGMQGGGQTIESQIAQQAKDIEDFKTTISSGELTLSDAPKLKAAENEVAGINRENQYRDGLLGSLRQGIEEAEAEIMAKTEEFEHYKDDYRAFVRSKAEGESMELLETRDGTVYRNVTIRKVTAIGMELRHEAGLKRIPFEDLTDEMQERFQFDPKQKAEAVSKELAVRKTHEASVSAVRKDENQQAAERRKLEAQAGREKALRSIAMMRARIDSLSDEIRSLEQAIDLEKYKKLSRAPLMREELSGKQRTLASLRAEVARLEGGL